MAVQPQPHASEPDSQQCTWLPTLHGRRNGMGSSYLFTQDQFILDFYTQEFGRTILAYGSECEIGGRYGEGLLGMDAG